MKRPDRVWEADYRHDRRKHRQPLPVVQPHRERGRARPVRPRRASAHVGRARRLAPTFRRTG